MAKKIIMLKKLINVKMKSMYKIDTNYIVLVIMQLQKDKK